MTDAARTPRPWSPEAETERRIQEQARFLAELWGHTPPPEPDLRPKDCPFVMCGMCNSFPAHWNATRWRCSRIQDSVEASDEACEKWTPREDWKPDPPMFSHMMDRPQHLPVPRYFDPVLPAGPPPNEEAECYVYFIQCGEFVKIGFSTNPHDRISAIRTSSAYAVEFIGIMVGTPADERQLHKQFGHLREKREWFRLTDEIREEIRNRCGGQKRWKKLLAGVKS